MAKACLWIRNVCGSPPELVSIGEISVLSILFIKKCSSEGHARKCYLFFCRKDSPDWQNRTRIHVVRVPIVIYVVYTYDGKNVAEYIRLGDGPVNVRDHDLVCVMPQVDVTPATGESQRRFVALWH